MLEYLAYKKYKKGKAERDDVTPGEDRGTTIPETGQSAADQEARTTPAPVLDEEDQRFLEQLTMQSSADEETPTEGSAPPLPPRINTPDLQWDSDRECFRRIGDPKPETTEDVQASTETKIASAGSKLKSFTLFMRRKKPHGAIPCQNGLVASRSDKLSVPEAEINHEKKDLTHVLDDLNLAAKNNKAFSMSAESTEMVRKFTVVLKDLVNGVPTAVDDLKKLFNDHDGTLAKQYEKLPRSLKKLVTQMPDKLSTTLAPELLAAAAEAQCLAKDELEGTGGIKSAAKRLLIPTNLSDLVTKPSAIVGMLKGIVNALKLRWPAFIGSPNLILSVAIFLLLFVLWYCHKRGREVRLEKEKNETVDAADGMKELPDHQALPAPEPGRSNISIMAEPQRKTSVPTRAN